ncbi:hypothetical protein AWENTII_011197 [Aspergillus wentii]
MYMLLTSNIKVFALEAIIKEQPSSGPLITFAQFLLTALFTFPSFLSFSAGSRFPLKPRAIPLKSWVLYTAFFVTVNLLNNWAFAYKISVPLHIILRSAGPVASMIIGYLFNGKTYSQGQIMAVAMLTLGVVGAALADAHAKGQSIGIGSSKGNPAVTDTITGFTILVLAMLLSAFQGIYADRLYENHGRNHWKEALFYSHMLSLPLFLPTMPQLISQWRALLTSPPLLSELSHPRSRFFSTPPSNAIVGITSMSTSTRGSRATSNFGIVSSLLVTIQQHGLVQSTLLQIPTRVAYLLMNAFTQYLCIRGVHLLSAKSSSLTVTIVLNIRKLVSLLISIYLFGNDIAPGIFFGATLVFVGGGLYGFEGARLKKNIKKRD